jgi:hypothetical protein
MYELAEMHLYAAMIGLLLWMRVDTQRQQQYTQRARSP